MRVIGIISEYDPFHNGHKYMIDKLRERSDADFVVCVMSGEFTQRGRPACFDKLIRAEMAVRGGADLVLELPYIYACNSSSEFAAGGIGILEGLGCVTHIGFGCESDDIGALSKLARFENAEVSASVKAALHKGLSYAEALTSAWEDFLGVERVSLLRRPNNLLAVEYLRALATTDSEIEPMAVRRVGAEHGCAGDRTSGAFVSGSGFASGSEIRRLLEANGGETASVAGLVPESSFALMQCSAKSDTLQSMFELLRYKLISTSAQELCEILEVTEGLENKMKKAIYSCNDIEELEIFIKSRRYTLAKIRRMLIHTMMNIRKEDFYRLRGTYYARVLSFNDKGSELLRHMRDTSRIPVISNLNRIKKYSENIRHSIYIDSKAVDIYDLITGNFKKTGRDVRIIPVKV